MAGTILPFNGMWPRIAETAFIAETAVIIGDVEVGPEASVWYGCVVRGDVNRIRIGARTNVQDGTIIHCNHDPKGDYRETGGGMPTLIGDNVTIGHSALIHACTIEDGGFVGMAATVMDEAVVESESMVAAGALVTPRKHVRTGEIWGGNPARRMREMTPDERRHTAYLAEHYAEQTRRYLAERKAAE